MSAMKKYIAKTSAGYMKKSGYDYINQYTGDDGRTYNLLSRWLKVHEAINPRADNQYLGYYRTDENGYREGQSGFDPTNGTYCQYFQFSGRKWPIEQFLCLGSVWSGGAPIGVNMKDGLHYIAGYDAENYYNPIMIEIDECGENVRVWQEA